MKKLKVNKQEFIIIFIIFFLMLLLNLITPMIMDDFYYSYGLNGRISSFKEILDFQVWHYLYWGGRAIAHTLVQFFLMSHKIIFDFFNSFMYVLLLYIIYLLISKGQKRNPLYLLLINFALWFSVPAYGQSFLWLTGSCNYLWTSTLILIFIERMMNEEFTLKKMTKSKVLLFFIFGVVVGWTNENSAAALIAIYVSYLFIHRFISKKKISSVQISGLLGSFIGFCILILAPGNYARSKGIIDKTPFILKMIVRLLNITEKAIPFIIVFVAILIIVLSVMIYRKQKIKKNIFVFLIGAFVSIYSMVLSPVFPERSWTIAIIFMILACGSAICHLEMNGKLKKFILMDFVILLSFVFFRGYILTVLDTYHLYKTWNSRINTMEKGKKKGTLDFEFDLIYTTTKQTPSYGLGDLYQGKDDLNNMCVAKYFKVNSVQAKTEKQLKD